MAILGGAVTNKFVIGNFELRVGPQNMAGKLTSAHSVGVIDRFAVRSQQQSADLMGLFPQELIDTDIVSQTTQLTATLREFSPRNMNMLLGNGLTEESGIVVGNTTSQLTSATVISTREKPSITVSNLALTSGGTVNLSNLNRKVWVIDDTGKFTQVNSGTTYDSTTGKITFSSTSTPWGTSTLAYYMISTYGAADKDNIAYLPLFVGKIVPAALIAAYTGKITTTGTGAAAVTKLEVFASTAAKATAAVNVADGISMLVGKYVEFCTATGTGSGTTVTLGGVSERFIKITAAAASGSLVQITLEKAPPSGATHYRLRGANQDLRMNFFGAVTSSAAYVAPTTTTGNTVQLSSEFSGVIGAYNNMKLTVSNLQFVIKDYSVAGGIRTAKVEYIGPNESTSWPSTTGATPKTIAVNAHAKITTITEAYSGFFANDAGASSVASTPITAIDLESKTVSFAHKENTSFTDYTATIRTTGGLAYYATVADSLVDEGIATVSFDSDSSSSFVSSLAEGDTIELNATNYKKGVTMLLAADDARYTNTTILKGTRLLLWDKSNHDEVQLVTVTDDSVPANQTDDEYRTIHFTPGLAFDAHVGYHGDYGIALVDPVSMGNQTGVSYLSASLIMKDRAIEAPIVFDFWKVAVSSGLNLSLNATDFSSVDLVLDVLEPTESDKTDIYPALASTISKHPLYRYSSTPDA